MSSVNASMMAPAIIITRPASAAHATVAALAARGIAAEALPLLEIVGLTPETEPKLQTSLDALSGKRVHGVIFVSMNAAEFGAPILLARGIGDDTTKCYAVGRATRAKLESLGVANVIIPDGGEDSEGLLALPAFSYVPGQTIALVKGSSEAGGRQLIAESLTTRGANVVEVFCYARRAVKLDQAARAALQRSIFNEASILVGSIETLESLNANLDRGMLAKVARVLVPHARVASAAEQLGARRVEIVSLEDNALADALSRLP
jgi:uroporphyrinogen-III synthase